MILSPTVYIEGVAVGGVAVAAAVVAIVIVVDEEAMT